jgi:hypothetical protein
MLPSLRTILVTAVLSGLIVLLFVRLTSDQRQRAIDELTALNRQMQHLLAEREAMIERLSRTRRMAHLEIVAQRRDDRGEVGETDVLFIELNDDGRAIAQQSFTVSGDVLFVDAWTAKFEPSHVAAGHPLHGRTLVLLRRIYSDRTAPIDGTLIDTPGAIPPAYAAGEAALFEKRIWEEFWRIAADRDLAEAMGVRIAQGEAVYKPVRTGQRYELVIDAAGGMNMTPLAAAK